MKSFTPLSIYWLYDLYDKYLTNSCFSSQDDNKVLSNLCNGALSSSDWTELVRSLLKSFRDVKFHLS